MKTVQAATLFASLVTAHSGVWKINIDGIEYPGRDARIDEDLGAKRIEWHRGAVMRDGHNAVNAWNPVSDVESEAITCGRSPSPPELKAVARAGADVVVQWSGMIKQHNGPVLSYLGALPSSDTKPQNVSWFKIEEGGWDKEKQLWKNEEVINRGYIDIFKLPSDIKPGMYILRTELVALHSNSRGPTDAKAGAPAGGPPGGFAGILGKSAGKAGGPPAGGGPGSGPQFFTHCFNVEITGDGTVTPEGVKIPGAYKRDDPGVKFNLYNGNGADWDTYVIPGPPKYQGKYDAPTGQQALLSDKDRGLFIPEFQFKYEAYKKVLDTYSSRTAKLVNVVVPGGKEGKAGKAGGMDMQGSKTLGDFYTNHLSEQKEIDKQFDDLKKEAVRLGVIRT